jgi:serine/threonine-protein kinase RsbW/stage II sporulation protein AB (anti-sigma F factor)
MMAALTFALSAPAEAASVPLLRREVVEFVEGADVCHERTADIRLAVSEALSNAVIHAYRHTDEPGWLEVSAERTDHTVEVIVRDCGSGLTPRNDSPGLGLGLPVIALTTDCYAIQCADGTTGTEIHMRFDC